MKFVIIFGPPAVGKMTVGFELEKTTGLRLYHNHESIETIIRFFDFGTPSFDRLIDVYRMELFKEVAKSDLDGMIFTYAWPFHIDRDSHIEEAIAIFEEHGADVYFIELFATQEERLQRNKHEFRLQQKATKRDVEASEKRLLEGDKKYRFNTEEGEFTRNNYIQIDNTTLSPQEVVSKIANHFGW